MWGGQGAAQSRLGHFHDSVVKQREAMSMSTPPGVE